MTDKSQPLFNNNIITELSHLGLIRISGQDAEKFLQGQLTCDVREINTHQSSLGAYCNHKGRILAIFRIFFYQDSYYLQMPLDIVENTYAQLKKYAAFSKVKLENITDDFDQIGCSGPQATGILKSIGLDVPLNINDAVVNNDFIILRIPGINPRLAIIGKFDIHVLQKQLNHSFTNVDFDIWKLLDIKAGIPSIYSSTLEIFTPHMVNLPQLDGVSFNKGCYVGQEVIARTQYLGKSKREMHCGYVNTDMQPLAGDKLITGSAQEVGIIVDSARSSNDGYEFLAVIQQDALANENIYFQKFKVKILTGKEFSLGLEN